MFAIVGVWSVVQDDGCDANMTADLDLRLELTSPTRLSADLDLRLELTGPTRLSWCPVRSNTKMLKLFPEVKRISFGKANTNYQSGDHKQMHLPVRPQIADLDLRLELTSPTRLMLVP